MLVSNSIMYKVVLDWNMINVMFSDGIVSHEDGILIVATNGNGL